MDVIRYLLSFLVAASEVFIIYYLADIFFHRHLNKASYLIGAFLTVFLFTVDYYFDSMPALVGGILLSILIITITSYGGFSELLPKILISFFIYWILDIGETIPVMLCMRLFGESYYITALQENMTIYIISCIGSKLLSFLMAILIKYVSKKRLISFSYKYKVFLLICPIISFFIYNYWCYFIYQGEKNDYIFTLGLAVTLFIINVLNIRMLNWICDDAEENAKNNMVHEYLKNERKHIEKLNIYNHEIRKMSHDLRHHLRTIYTLLSSNREKEATEYVRKLTEDAQIKPGAINSGNTLMDAVIEEYYAYAEKNHIKIELSISVFENLPVNEIGIVIVLGNALENAIEYCVKEKINQIKLSIRCNDKFLILEVVNPIHKTIPDSNPNFFATAKGNAVMHGIGIQSMKETVASMNGDLSIKVQDDTFLLTAMVPLMAVSPQNPIKDKPLLSEQTN